MKKELDEKLVKDFPLLYADRTGAMSETCMYWGFCVGDGWYNLIYELSSKLEELIQEIEDVGWSKETLPRASQVKEKYGKLCFYMSTSSNEMEVLIVEAESLSAETCEVCGQKGSLYKNFNWRKTMCDKCAKEINERDGRSYKKVIYTSTNY